MGLMNLGVCCSILSVWAIIQLSLMGVFFKMESVTLIEDAHPHNDKYEDYDEFIKKTEENYFAVALNCWIVAGIYFVMLIISICCIRKAKSNEKKRNALQNDDEKACSPKPPPKKKKIEE